VSFNLRAVALNPSQKLQLQLPQQNDQLRGKLCSGIPFAIAAASKSSLITQSVYVKDQLTMKTT
jgi:hypothetical protein